MSIYVFDAYGTLFDVHAALRRFRDRAGPDADRMSDIWRTKQLENSWTLTMAGRYAPFWTLTERALDFALARVPSVDKALKPQLMQAYFNLDAFPDARLALRTLKSKGHKTGILSNGSPAMLQGAVDNAGIGGDLDGVLSVDVLKMFKPRPEVYALVTVRPTRSDARSYFGASPLQARGAHSQKSHFEHPPSASPSASRQVRMVIRLSTCVLFPAIS